MAAGGECAADTLGIGYDRSCERIGRLLEVVGGAQPLPEPGRFVEADGGLCRILPPDDCPDGRSGQCRGDQARGDPDQGRREIERALDQDDEGKNGDAAGQTP